MSIKIRKLNTQEYNAVIVSLFLFQYSLLTPLMNYINGTILVGISGIILVVCLLLKNFRCRANSKVYFSFILIVFLLLFNTLITGATIQGVAAFVLISLPVVVLLSYEFDYLFFLHTCCTLSIVSFFVLVLYPFLPRYEYMRFGYGMLPVVLFSYVAVVYPNLFGDLRCPNKKLTIVILVLGLAEMFLYGARGTIVAVFLFLAIDRLLINKKNVLKNGIILIFGLIMYIYLIPIIDFFEKISYRLGIYSYSITKFKMQLAGGIQYASSGRTRLYTMAIERIKQHPLIGNGINAVEEGTEYAHNLFLQVGEDLGVVAIIILSFFLIWQLYLFWTNKKMLQDKLIREVLFSISIGRLLFSSTLWRRPEFWMLFFFAVASGRYHLQSFGDNM